MKIRVETSTPGLAVELDRKEVGVTPLDLTVEGPETAHLIRVYARWKSSAHPSIAGQAADAGFVISKGMTPSGVRTKIHQVAQNFARNAALVSRLYPPAFTLQDTSGATSASADVNPLTAYTSTDNSEPVILKWNTADVEPLEGPIEGQLGTASTPAGPAPTSVARKWSITVSPRDVGLIAGTIAVLTLLFRRK